MDLTKGVVCILDASDKPAGTGFVVADDLIATCAHVLGEPRPAHVTVVFQATNERRETKVIDEWWRPEDAEDVAILQVIGTLPQAVQPFPLGTATGTGGHAIHTFGFPPAGEGRGMPGTGIVLGLEAKTGMGGRLLQICSSEITAGFNGAPLWDESQGRVIGMVARVAKPDPDGKPGEAAFATPTETLQHVCPELRVADVCPYRNLEAFTEADTACFFGRERIIDEMVNSLREEARFLAVLGPSGCGKSSVVQAGLVPSLRRGAVDGSDRWEIIVMRPSDPPFASLLMTLPQPQQAHVALIIDQFEELFVTSDSAANLDSVERLIACLDHLSHLSIVVVLRDVFYSRFVQQERLARWLKRGLINISPILTRNEVVSIIQEPAHAIGLRLEGGLVEIILADVLDKALHAKENERVAASTVLPFLEFALTQLWEYRHDGTMTRDAYEAIGRVAGGIAQSANQTFSSFDTKQQFLARRIFTDLVYLGDEEQAIPDSRRRRELLSLFRSEAEQAEVSYVVQQLVTARLLVISQDTKSGKETVEIIHDTLLREWSLLKQWMTEDRSFLLWHHKLEQSIQEWRAADASDPPRPGSDQLFTGRDLAAAGDWQTERREDSGNPEQDSVGASKEQEERRLQKLNEEAVRQRQAVLARGLAAQAEQLHDEWDDLLQRRVLLALEAVRRFPHPETVQALGNGLARLRRRLVSLIHDGGVTAVSFSPDGNLLATARLGGLIGIWQFASEHQVSTFTHEGGVIEAVFSSSGHLLATIGNDDSVKVWDTISGSQLASFPHMYRVIAVDFSPEGRFLAAISGGIVEVWDVSSGQFLTSPSIEDNPVAVTFRSDGHLLVASDSGRTVQIWNTTRHRRVAGLVHNGHVSSAILSPDRRFLATVSGENNRVDVWDISSGRHIISLAHRQRVTSVAFSPRGRLLAIATLSSVVGIWDLSNSHRLASLLHQEVVTGVAFSPDGLLVATACLDGTATVWDATSAVSATEGGENHPRSFRHTESVTSITLSSDGCRLATISDDNEVRVWDTLAGHQLAALQPPGRVIGIAFSVDECLLIALGQESAVEVRDVTNDCQLAFLSDEDTIVSGALSSDGRLLVTITHASSSSATVLRVWDVVNRRLVLSLPHKGDVTGATLSNDGHLLAVTSPDFSNAVRVWDIASGLHLGSLQHQDWATVIAFSPSGHLLAIADLKGFIAVWDISSWHRLTAFAYEGVVTAVAFSPNGHLLAIADLKGSLAVWDISNGYQLTTFFSHESAITAVTFSLDGHLLITASKDKTVRIWPWRPDELMSDACSRLTRNLTVEEWRWYIGDEPYRRTCANLP